MKDGIPRRETASVRLHAFPVRQLVGPGETKELPLLPSFLYRPGPHDLPPGATELPWDKAAKDVVGAFARNHGAKVPGRWEEKLACADMVAGGAGGLKRRQLRPPG